MEQNLPEKAEKQEGEVPAVIPKKDTQKLDFQSEITKLIPTAGTIELTERQKEILYAPIKEEDIEIRSDGLIYLPWMEYVIRLSGAFPLGWAAIPQGMPSSKGDYILWPFFLVIQGKIAGFAVGEQQYYANNMTMTYGDALEGAKSNALMRLCKGIGIGLDLWKPSFIKKWKEKNAETYDDVDKYGKKKTKWRKKGQEAEPNGETQSEPEPQPDKTKFPDYEKSLRECKNTEELQNWWKAYNKDAKKNLSDKGFDNLVILKNNLKIKLGGEKKNEPESGE